MDDKRKSYHNINTKADKAVIRVRLERPPGWHKGHDLDSFHLALQKEQGLENSDFMLRKVIVID